MLVEPVLISSRRETVKSRLALVLDDSESMKFSDPYTDESRAAEIASALKLGSEGKKSPVIRLRETPRLDLVKSALRPHLEALGRGRDTYMSTTWRSATRERASGGMSAQDAEARRREGEPRHLRAGGRDRRACWRRTAGQPVAGPGPGDRRAVECGRGPAEGGGGGGSGEHPDLCHRRRGRRGGRATSGWPRSRRARSSSPETL